MIRLSPLLIWASLSISVASEGCFSNIVWPGLKKVESASGGWNGVGRGFLSMFVPETMTDNHWQLIAKIFKNASNARPDDDSGKGQAIIGLALSLHGLIFLTVVSFILIVLFCAAPCALGCYLWKCKKKCKPKSNAIVTYTGIGCNSLAILTIFLSAIFLYVAIGSFSAGIKNMAESCEPLPDVVMDLATTFKEQFKCTLKSLSGALTKSIDDFPVKLSRELAKIPELKAVTNIKFDEMNAKIEGFIATAEDLSAELGRMETDNRLSSLSTIVSAVQATRTEIDAVKDTLSSTGQNSIKTTLAGVEQKQKMAFENEIANTIRDKCQTHLVSSPITEFMTKADNDIDVMFKGTEGMRGQLKSFVDDRIKGNADNIVGYMSYGMLLNFVLFPCYLAMVSSCWSTVQSILFVRKKEAKSKDKFGPLIPISIGLTLAFVPLILAILAMNVAGFTGVICNTFFHDKSMGYVPKAFKAMNYSPHFKVLGGESVEIQTALQECRAGKNLLSIIKYNLFTEETVTKDVDFGKIETDYTKTITDISFDLPDATMWQNVENEIGVIDGKRTAAETQIDSLRTAMSFESTAAAILGPTVLKMDLFVKAVEDFQRDCNADVATGKALDMTKISVAMATMLYNGGGTGMLNSLTKDMKGEFYKIADGVLTNITNCGFVFDAVENVGQLVCDQGTSGLFGIYSAIGLGVLSFFSACAGTVLIWHTQRAGKGPQDQKKAGDEKDSSKKKDKKKSKKKKGGKSGKEGGEEDEAGNNKSTKTGESVKSTRPDALTPSAEPDTPPPAAGEKNSITGASGETQ